MVHRLFYLTLLFSSTFASAYAQQDTHQQQAVVQRGARVAPPTRQVAQPSQSAQRLPQLPPTATWSRIIYRQLDLKQPANAVLYHRGPSGSGDKNLFELLFDSYSSGALSVYEYVDGAERFDSEHQLAFKDFLDRFHIAYTTERRGGQTHYIVRPADVPALEVQAYYLKEAYFFDQATSSYQQRVLALCPILQGIGDYGEAHMPLFWVSYPEVSGLLSSHLTMLSDRNNARQATLDDYFRLHLYQGQIIKADNLRDISLPQYCPTPDSLAKEQQRIEKELVAFRSSVYIPDSVLHAADPQPTTKVARSQRSARSSQSFLNSRSRNRAASTPKQPKTPRNTSTATRSVRNRG